MRDAVQLRRLVARAGADPGAEGDGGDARHGIRGDRESGRQPGYPDAHAAPFARTGALRRLLRTKSCKTEGWGERRVGQAGVREGGCRWSAYNLKKPKKKK